MFIHKLIRENAVLDMIRRSELADHDCRYVIVCASV
jgi:hypothetical protein